MQEGQQISKSVGRMISINMETMLGMKEKHHSSRRATRIGNKGCYNVREEGTEYKRAETTLEDIGDSIKKAT